MRPRGVAASGVDGHVFVADGGNFRIVELDPLGAFVKTWGRDVVASGPDNAGTGFEICKPQAGDLCKAGVSGAGSGQFSFVGGVAVDSAGNIYATDRDFLSPPSVRVQKFSPDGQFLAAFGGDVVAFGPDDSSNEESQEITISQSSGTFRLGFANPFPAGGRSDTAPLPFNASAAEIQAALNALPSIAGAGGSVSVSGSNPFTVSFQGNLAGDDVPQLTVALDVGAQLQCSTPTAAESISYQWLRNGSKIDGASASTYTATAQDAGKAIQCQITATNANAGSTQAAEPAQPIAPTPANPAPIHPAPIPAPVASAPLTVGGGGGQTLDCAAGQEGWQNLGGFINFRWYRNGGKIEGAFDPTYTVTTADLASPAVFQCEVFANGGFQGVSAVKVSANLASTPAPNAPPAPEVQANMSPANLTATVLDGGGPEVCEPADSCKAGRAGSGKGQFGAWAIGDFISVDDEDTATDADDSVYVGDVNRIQRFDSAGVYLDECSVPGKVQSLDVDSSGSLYVAYENQEDVRKLAYVAGGACTESTRFEIPKLGILGEFGTFPTAVAVDAEAHVYAFCCPNRTSGSPTFEDPIFEFDPAGNVVDQFGKEEFAASNGLAANLCAGSAPPGNLYVTNQSNAPNGFLRAYGTLPLGCFKALTEEATNVTETSATLNGSVDPDGEPTSECRFEWGTTTAYGNEAPCLEAPSGTERVPVHADISDLEGATVYHFRLRAKIGSDTETGPDKQFKTLGPPTIGDEHLVVATHEEALVKALVNPEGLATTCRVEYGATTAYGQSTPEVSVGEDRSEHVTGIVVTGLEPGAEYHWRFVCENEAILNDGITEGEDRTLIVYRPFGTETGCANDPFRGGGSALLPDCRAYELVSPVDKNGADIVTQADDGGSYVYVQARPDGDRLAYGSKSPTFGEDPANSFVVNQYLADRGAGGWSSEGIHPPFLGRRIGIGVGANRDFMAFTPDLCSAWLVDGQTPPLNPDGQEDVANLYRRQNCDPLEGSFETLTTAPLLEGTPIEYVSKTSVQGVSDDGSHAIFVAKAKLTDDAAAGSQAQLYDRFGGALHLVSVLPGGVASTTDASVGSGWQFHLDNAVSADGSAVYWTADFETDGRGTLYLRQRPEQGIVGGECADPAKACTTQVSAGDNAFFWAAAADGSAALYSEGNPEASAADLFLFAGATKTSHLLVEDIMGVAGASQDLSRVYFVSRKAIPGSGANSFGEEASEDKPNLYLAEAGGFEFIATLVEGDVGGREPGATVVAYSLINAVHNTYRPATRVTPDGASIVFQSRAPISEFDNGTQDGEAAVEVYLYRPGGELLCVSCNPSRARPTAEELHEPYKRKGRITSVFAAAWIPTWEHPLHASNVLADDGQRLFFNANDALVPHDTNGTQDVYEWEALGTGGCDANDPSYFSQNDGCVYLISSGQSSFESTFWEASPDGEDVFFTTVASLLAQDPGSIDLYDARVGGGFPQPLVPAACEGEACQGPLSPPNDPTPASSTFEGAGNVVVPNHRRCPQGKHRVRRRGKVRCVKRKAKRRRAGHRRGAPR